jgi:hypothetical protein
MKRKGKCQACGLKRFVKMYEDEFVKGFLCPSCRNIRVLVAKSVAKDDELEAKYGEDDPRYIRAQHQLLANALCYGCLVNIDEVE